LRREQAAAEVELRRERINAEIELRCEQIAAEAEKRREQAAAEAMRLQQEQFELLKAKDERDKLKQESVTTRLKLFGDIIKN
jgi:hypothetical protein